MTVLYLVRHGETTWNRERRWQGQNDMPLTALGREQADAVARRVAGESLDAIYASDLARAWETAAAIAAATGLDPVAEPGLREVDVGSWAGLTPAEVRERDPDGLARWEAGGTGWQDGETYEAMAQRAVATAERICASRPGSEHVALVCHGGVIRGLVMHALGLPSTARRRLATGPTGALSLIDARGPRWVLMAYNDAGHLGPLAAADASQASAAAEELDAPAE